MTNGLLESQPQWKKRRLDYIRNIFTSSREFISAIHINDLPPEVLQHIFSFVNEENDFSTCCKVSHVCSKWRQLIELHSFSDKKNRLSDTRMELLSSRFSKSMKSISIAEHTNLTAKGASLLEQFTSLTSLSLSCSLTIPISTLFKILCKLSKLEYLSLSNRFFMNTVSTTSAEHLMQQASSQLLTSSTSTSTLTSQHTSTIAKRLESVLASSSVRFAQILIEHNKSLRNLSLNLTNVEADAIALLLLRHPALIELQIKDPHFFETPHADFLISEALRNNQLLQTFWLQSTKLTLEGTNRIATALMGTHSLKTLGIDSSKVLIVSSIAPFIIESSFFNSLEFCS